MRPVSANWHKGAKALIVHIDRLIKHLETQISEAEHIKSDWVYITLPQAKKCLELAQAEDVIIEILSTKRPDNKQE